MMKERKATRLQGYDYSSDNLYFVTSCVHNRICCFGEIVSDNLASSVGTGRDPSLHDDDKISVGTGRDLSLQNTNISLFISTRKGGYSVKTVIPHMILNEYGLIAEKQWYWLSQQYPYVALHEFVVMPNHVHGIIEINRSRIKSSDQIKIKSLSELIGAYKTTVSKQIHLLECMDRSRLVPEKFRPVSEFAWQRSFYEHIVRDEKSLETISDYIFSNPLNWEQDKFYNL